MSPAEWIGAVLTLCLVGFIVVIALVLWLVPKVFKRLEKGL